MVSYVGGEKPISIKSSNSGNPVSGLIVPEPPSAFRRAASRGVIWARMVSRPRPFLRSCSAAFRRGRRGMSESKIRARFFAITSPCFQHPEGIYPFRSKRSWALFRQTFRQEQDHRDYSPSQGPRTEPTQGRWEPPQIGSH